MSQRHWVFTVFGEQATERPDRFLVNPPHDERIRYAIWQQERCPESNRLHLQGYAEFRRPVRIRQAKELLRAPTAHVEPRRGSRDDARAYASKEETRIEGPWEIGEWIKGSGSRSDLDSLHRSLSEGSSLLTISDEHFPEFLKYHRSIQQWQLLHQGRRNWPMEIIVIYGPTGTGKTSAAWQSAPEAYLLPPQQSASGTGWWDGYNGESDIIIDEFYGWLRYSFLLQLLDRYPLRVETKGGSVNFVGRRVFMTSNHPPSSWYDPLKFSWAPLERRITKIFEMKNDVTIRHKP